MMGDRVLPSAAELAASVNTSRLATLGMLVAGVAHEINTPLGALNSNHDVLRRALERLQLILEDDRVDETELDEVRRIVRAIDDVMQVNTRAVERMVEIVASLRSFGRLDRARRDRVDLHEGLDSALALLAHETRGRVEVVRDYASLPRVECYPQQVNQLFMNLLLNAVQAIRGPGTVTVRTRADGDSRVRVAISDTGIGIPPQLLERVWEPGFTTKGSRIGMGLGLLICRRIAELHGAAIDVQSVVGKGTTFSVMMPLALPADPPPEPL